MLIMSPWNYPFQLTIAPLVGAICAGNCAVVKPSAYSPHTTKVMADMLRELFQEKYIAVVEGGRQENQAPVSYTHLDVYKRQDHNQPGGTSDLSQRIS